MKEKVGKNWSPPSEDTGLKCVFILLGFFLEIRSKTTVFFLALLTDVQAAQPAPPLLPAAVGGLALGTGGIEAFSPFLAGLHAGPFHHTGGKEKGTVPSP